MTVKRKYDSLSDWLERTNTPQYVLAKLAKVGPSHLSYILSGSKRCSLEKAMRLSRVTGVPVENICRWPNVDPRERFERALKKAVAKCA